MVYLYISNFVTKIYLRTDSDNNFGNNNNLLHIYVYRYRLLLIFKIWESIIYIVYLLLPFRECQSIVISCSTIILLLSSRKQ